MRKRLISPSRKASTAKERNWLDLDETAVVEVTSEAADHPVEEALLRDGRGWRAEAPGPQTIRLLFDRPQTIHLIRLLFREEDLARTQEFVLRWLPSGTESWKDLVRQQWNFSPPQTIEEGEEYNFELPSAAALELTITPDISLGQACASLQRLQVAVGSVTPSRR
jgi:hypothetical protein